MSVVPKKSKEWVETQKNFPLFCTAIDRKHVAIKRLSGCCSQFYNYKGGVGTNGRADDGNIFQLSSFKSVLANCALNFPNDHFILGDNTFPLSPTLMESFSKRNLSLEKRIFNYGLACARRVVENAFGIMAALSRIFRREIEVDSETQQPILKKGWVDHEDTYTGAELPPLRGARSANTHSKTASETWKKLAEHFSGEGRVCWQMKAVGMTTYYCYCESQTLVLIVDNINNNTKCFKTQ
ncbi:uncharacterized protein LOC126252740 [Schistocerca nitens]|uniref:uncharacterized protein LOC126252740 n=1 Tax=Schistocerca nitens TaxID=7011 RepID=UPI00211966F3|nr:uncharacterized protein LOC126252740 [Schistocerca nitens]